jgi:hypothetical protein
MICPQCKAEYRRGFAECADCGVALVEGSSVRSEPAATPGDPRKDPFCSFWKGTDLRVCTEICAVLDEAGIPHKTIRRQDHLFNLNNQAPYEVGVPASLYEKAELAIKEAFGSEEEGGKNPLLLSEENSASFRELLDMPLEEKLRGRPDEEVPGWLESLTWRKRGADGEEETKNESKPGNVVEDGNWNPEDATAEVWAGEPAEAREIIEMSLKENDIWMRWEMREGKPQLFVSPEDEERAKEIVREILEGQPPE